jgi:aldehyde dehydrogenase (NAD+)
MTTSYSALLGHLRRSFRAGKLKSREARVQQLEALKKLVTSHSEELCLAVTQDLRRSHYETFSYEIGSVVMEIDTAIDNLKDWMKPKKVKRNFMQLLDGAEVSREPLGIVCLISPWNYPVRLLLMPLAGALAAGNCVVIKPSEVSTNTSNAISKLIPQYLDQDLVRVVMGGVSETTELLRERFDYIFYTGSTNVGKIIMEAASKHLTPVTLELGGKSPVVLDSNVDLAVAAKRIAWGKFLNSGQTCVAPDYVLCMDPVKDEFIKQMAVVVEEFFGKDPLEHDDYARLINERHFDRIYKLMTSSGEVAFGGKVDRSERYIQPTVLKNVKGTDPIMQEEIFGPVLPVISINNVDEAIDFINDREKPLALYVFSANKKFSDRVVANTSSGGVTVNDCILHMALDTLPFGGVGHSGMGRYHGKFTFDTFSHAKAVLKRGLGGEQLLWMRYPPLNSSKFKWAQFMTKKRPLPDGKWLALLPILLAGVLLGYFIRWLQVTF